MYTPSTLAYMLACSFTAALSFLSLHTVCWLVTIPCEMSSISSTTRYLKLVENGNISVPIWIPHYLTLLWIFRN